MNELLSQVLSAIDFGQIVTLVVMAFMAPIFARLGRWIDGKVKSVDNALITAGVAAAVRFVEQKYKTLDSIEKYRIARDRAISFLTKKGIKVDEEDIQIMIEAAVEALTNEINLSKN